MLNFLKRNQYIILIISNSRNDREKSDGVNCNRSKSDREKGYIERRAIGIRVIEILRYNFKQGQKLSIRT